MKNKTSLSIIASVLYASTAYAGNLAVPEVGAVAIAAPAANDWAGLYAGGLVSFDSGEIQYFKGGEPGPTDLFESTTAFGGFAGYNIQHGAMVFGGELAVSSGGVAVPWIHGYEHGPIIDLKARAGYSMGKALVYGVVGGSFSTADNGFDPIATSGFAYGAGVDFMIGEHMFVGAEYLVRDLTGASELNSSFNIESHIESAQLRVGWNF